MPQQIKRMVAKKLLIGDIVSATYIKRAGWEPNGILTQYGEISRVNIFGVIVSITDEDNTQSFILDDGSGNILIRFFDKISLDNYKLGDLINVIGKPREWQSTKYIVPEIIKLVNDLTWYEVHQKEIKLNKKQNPLKLPVEIEDTDSELKPGPYQQVLNIIAMLDKGDGAPVQEIVNNININNAEQIVQNLIEEGEVFQISPGKVMLLE